MKTRFLCLLTILLFSCNINNQIQRESPEIAPDTVYVEVPILNEERIKELENDVEFWKQKALSKTDSVKYEDYMNARRIEKIKYYISICERKSSNKKFFYGWIKRTMSDN